MRLYDKQGDKEAIRLSSSEKVNMINLYNQRQEIGATIYAGIEGVGDYGNVFFVVDKTGKRRMLGDE